MRIEYLQISNVLSFPYRADVRQADKIEFDDGLNIIIGENGSGKSTALEVVNFLFRRVIYRQFSFNRELFGRRSTLATNDRRQVLQPANHTNINGFRLDANWDSEDEEQRIRIAVRLDDIDRQNIANIRTYFVELTQTLGSYSNYNVNANGEERDTYVIDVILNRAANSFSIQLQDGEHDFGFTYLTDYHLFREAISLHNALTRGEPIPPLYESFTLIGSYRNYHAFQPSISLSSASASQQIQDIRNQDFNRSLNATDSNEPPVFALVRLQVAERHFNLISEAKDLAQCEQEANDLRFVRKVNERLRVVNLRCQIKLLDQRTWQYSFEFYDTRRNKPIGDINSLSAGQKAIIHLVLEAYGRGELKGGVVIIDEPEIHLHYQFQHEYLQVLRELNRTQNCQYILVTHSESLINSSTISSVRRFALNANGHTSIFSPTLSADEKSLIRILDNSRSTYAFFSKKVVLVEGDTDRYFFRALLQERHRLLEQEIAVLHVGGKRELPKWNSLFSSFGLRVYAIADFDYVVNLHYPADNGVLLRTAEQIAAFKQSHLDWGGHIDTSASDGMFVLREGDLETYLDIGKDLSHVIEFCQNGLLLFLADDTSSKSREIRSIIDAIAE
ncbi:MULTISPECIES: AAA family ATPase [unclassified Rhizobium]|uniref:AAA family ATPase n=1 Tax=unclassified Rhizobium TaxID=2613769 RepID=UPI000CDF4E91|nr:MULTISPECIES: AAA family ATPase [Rhizobium]AVA20603.1 TROPIM/AAA ATPase domain-containing protein [Rhizobium sp. NXC24]UWU21875.1 AAA family ATPase [Rhizobium tropici]